VALPLFLGDLDWILRGVEIQPDLEKAGRFGVGKWNLPAYGEHSALSL